MRPASGKIGSVYRALYWSDQPAVVLLDQTRLPGESVELTCPDVASLVAAMKRLAVRGAPLLGIAGGYGVALAVARGEDVELAAYDLAHARPTAVNLTAGVVRVFAAWKDSGGDPAATLAAARALHAEEDAASEAMATHGLTLVPDGAKVLTHCNTGALATGGAGSAFAVALGAHKAGKLAHLWVDETRPLLQGARLTAWEATQHGIPHTVLVDGAAAALMAAGEVDLVLVGADRIAADGAVANKVGTYGLAVIATYLGVPFVVVAPTSTIDLATPHGAAISVEQRDADEVATVAGHRVTPADSAAWNPAFDVTPAGLITALVTERGVLREPDRAGIAALTAR
jgi:methylthioribose-1-phosphate isomerase